MAIYLRQKLLPKQSFYRLFIGLFLAAYVMNSASSLVTAADTGGYPWALARPTVYVSTWYEDENSDGLFAGPASTEIFDPYGFAYRNCTSWVAWKLATYGFKVPYGSALGNANTWDDNAAARGFRVDHLAHQGAVAVWNSGKWGHVGFVESVDDHGTLDPGDDLVTISEYNAVPAFGGTYSRRSGLQAEAYIHFLPETVAPQPAPVVSAAAQTTPAVAEPAAAQTATASVSSPATPSTPVIEPTLLSSRPVMPEPDYSKAKLLAVDLNGDNTDQIVTISPFSGGGTVIYWQSPTSLSIKDAKWLSLPDIPFANSQWLSGDTDGDKASDLLAITTDKTGTIIHVLLAKTGQLTAPTVWAAITDLPAGINRDYQIGNHNHDAMSDLLITYLPGANSPPTLVWYISNGKNLEISK